MINTLKHTNMKTKKLWGIELTDLQAMKFSKYLSNNGIAPNTMIKEERENLLLDWLKLN